jgi:hypothetical protein
MTGCCILRMTLLCTSMNAAIEVPFAQVLTLEQSSPCFRDDFAGFQSMVLIARGWNAAITT